MRLHEFSNPLKTYLATVRVVLYGASTTVRTTITADSTNDAKKLLAAIVGVNNVLSIAQIVSEAPQTDQIQREAAIRPKLKRRRAKPRKFAQIQSSQVQQQPKQPRRRQVSTRPVAAPIKHDLVQNRLTKQLMRQSNIVKPTSDDIRIAKSRAETALKRADLEYQHKLDQQLQRQVREKR